MILINNLDFSKNIALTLLQVPPEYNKEYPFIVYHPFIENNPVPTLDKNGKLKVIDIFNDKDGFKKVQKKIENDINKANNFSKLLYLINKPYRMLFLLENYLLLNSSEFTKHLRNVWIDTEFPNADKNVSINKIIKMFQTANKIDLMDDEELDLYNKLPEEVTIYRGTHDSANSNALSWTLDYDIARWFATRFDNDGYVLKANINKKDIFAFFNSRRENEIVINYKKIKDLTFEKVIKINI